jgi:3-oxoisoapionate kinase
VTPIDEADVARHVGRQTDASCAALTLPEMATASAADRALERLVERNGIVAIDAVSAADMRRAGALIWRHRDEARFAIGSQGVEYALVAAWRQAGLLPGASRSPRLAPVDRIAVVSGSGSAVTRDQIARAERAGFGVIELEAARLLHGARERDGVVAEAVRQSLDLLEQRVSPIVCSARGPNDPAMQRCLDQAKRTGLPQDTARLMIGDALGDILSAVVRRAGLARAVVAGGDTSGQVVKRLGVHALTAVAPATPGAALFAAHRTNGSLELALKGGQMGEPGFFLTLRDGAA